LKTEIMPFENIDYNKTVDTNKLVYKGQKFDKISSLIILLVMDSIGVFLIYSLIESQLRNNPTFTDYIISILFSLIILLIIIFGSKNVLNREKLREIELLKGNKEEIKFKLIKAARNLNWELSLMRENYVIFDTKYKSSDGENVTLIFSIDNRIFFNSMSAHYSYLQPARFDSNYNALLNEYLRIENE